MSTSPLFDALWRSGALRTLDHALAQSLKRLDPATPDGVLAAAALASLAVANGHAGFDLASPRTLVDAQDIPWPDADAWRRELAASPWVAVPANGADISDATRPLVLEGAPGAPGLLYLRRYREYERRVAAGLQRLAAQRGAGSHIGDSDIGGVDLVTGGPGTGKTTTIARLLVQLVEQARAAGRDDPRIALAAPTGRAAERMAESVRNALQALATAGTDAGVIAALPTSGTTLHRLLGTIPDSPRFRHDAGNPLPFDVVVVDEASMIDLPLMAKLVEAVPDGARLVLIGDPDQLPSVEAGDVLSGILHGAEAGGDAFTARRTHLTRTWRQHEALQLAPLAAAVREGDSAAALALLRGGELSGVHFHEGLADPLQAPHRERLLEHWRALANVSNPAEALRLASRLRLLTAVRDGPQGARTLNARIETMLGAGGDGASGGGAHFHGRLILITENSYRHRLFNGDIGICFRDADGAVMAWFPGESTDKPRVFHPAGLPQHDSAFAMTVHKSQGSEFDEVWLLLPQHDSRVLSRELVYTGITRARRELHVAASADAIATALGRHASRCSGLGWRLDRDKHASTRTT
ncbi:exodeoxyribonuclease V subunit alpha [Luteimonas sp. 50]|uniref:RecBCD enzyme subunit RecD n=1 Tax=Cognatiluteimonas sedimenti TaxID=2927791 RepID=A0ABT0A5I6_9GAMM|nr:exodeoxyribonuclease V subunit alpha [Lysobacter sedimenti]MCJ0826260.1 exodeoxyribonuclease V subunit alpha [Lysobacter sedimenti]